MKNERTETAPCYARIYKYGKFVMAISLEQDAEEVVQELLDLNQDKYCESCGELLDSENTKKYRGNFNNCDTCFAAEMERRWK